MNAENDCVSTRIRLTLAFLLRMHPPIGLRVLVRYIVLVLLVVLVLERFLGTYVGLKLSRCALSELHPPGRIGTAFRANLEGALSQA